MPSLKEHWDHIFLKTDEKKLGWYEKDSSQTFKLLDEIPGKENAAVLIPGAGTSILIEDLVPVVNKLILNDISEEALNRVRRRLKEGTEKIVWLCQDIAQPIKAPLPAIDIWIDRAVLHFLTRLNDITGYFDNLKSVLKPGGYAFFAEFSLAGAPKCAGLTLHRYSADELAHLLGSAFDLVSHFDFTYINPSGDPRPYVYALFKRQR